MSIPDYCDILDLFRQGATAEAEQKFTALHEKTIARRQQDRQRHQAEPAAELLTDRQPAWDGTAYYLVENGRKIGLFCRRCYDRETKLIKLQAADSATYLCLACQTKYKRDICG